MLDRVKKCCISSPPPPPSQPSLKCMSDSITRNKDTEENMNLTQMAISECLRAFLEKNAKLKNQRKELR